MLRIEFRYKIYYLRGKNIKDTKDFRVLICLSNKKELEQILEERNKKELIIKKTCRNRKEKFMSFWSSMRSAKNSQTFCFYSHNSTNYRYY